MAEDPRFCLARKQHRGTASLGAKSEAKGVRDAAIALAERYEEAAAARPGAPLSGHRRRALIEDSRSFRHPLENHSGRFAPRLPRSFVVCLEQDELRIRSSTYSCAIVAAAK